MDSDPPARPQPGLTPAAEAARRARQEREAAALRDNLRRRKAQARDRQPPATPPAPATDRPDEPPCR